MDNIRSLLCLSAHNKCLLGLVICQNIVFDMNTGKLLIFSILLFMRDTITAGNRIESILIYKRNLGRRGILTGTSCKKCYAQQSYNGNQNQASDSHSLPPSESLSLSGNDLLPEK